jgi:hypothetical protein
MTFLPSSNTQSEGTAELMLTLDDSQNFDDDSGQAKRPRASDRNQGRLSSAMINVGVPYPLCRFVVDLLGGDCSNSLLFRSDNSFESFSDVLADLKQMMGNPEAFIHLSVKDQWRLAFGHKLHGRETEKGIIIDVASRITGATSNDALFEALAMVRPLNVFYLNNSTNLLLPHFCSNDMIPQTGASPEQAAGCAGEGQTRFRQKPFGHGGKEKFRESVLLIPHVQV